MSTPYFLIGQKVLYVPNHANGDIEHPDVERGVVSSVNGGVAGGYVFVAFGESRIPKACHPKNLVIEHAPREAVPTLSPALWPSVWHYNYWSDLQGNNENRCGARTKYLGEKGLLYICPCGRTFPRRIQEQIEEARDWIAEHTPHLPPEEQVE